MTIQELHFELAKLYVLAKPGLRTETAIEYAQEQLPIWLRKFPGLVDLKVQAQETKPVTKTVTKTQKGQEAIP